MAAATKIGTNRVERDSRPVVSLPTYSLPHPYDCATPASRTQQRPSQGFVDLSDDLSGLMRDEQARITEIPLQRRAIYARAFLAAVGVDLADLSPSGGSAP